MATKTITYTETYDDLDGSLIQEGETIRFTVDDTAYEIDLSTENAAAFKAFLAPYREAARTLNGSHRQGSSTPQSKRSVSRQNARIRDWARSNGYTVNERGKLTQPILDAFERAHAAQSAQAA